MPVITTPNANITKRLVTLFHQDSSLIPCTFEDAVAKWQVVGFEVEGFQARNPTPPKIGRVQGLLHVKPDVVGQTPFRRCCAGGATQLSSSSSDRGSK
ncbi:hypothetical protein AVEN_137718-1 [Araneus ventricosus]|uniref:Uncharacterized protein n=1 Tax=Araneus ventricosus TaxID=182803 RepID=A0A4Y2JCZ8_ARAVE|nr:hypothetical protein AVEN_137718-1 [Araneus ventricosus]